MTIKNGLSPISIHAPSRERPYVAKKYISGKQFQSTLPRGSDDSRGIAIVQLAISIHAPSRERRADAASNSAKAQHFNPRSLAGATDAASFCSSQSAISIHAPSRERQSARYVAKYSLKFQSTLPRGSDSIKMMYFYNYVNQAFVANKLN